MLNKFAIEISFPRLKIQISWYSVRETKMYPPPLSFHDETLNFRRDLRGENRFAAKREIGANFSHKPTRDANNPFVPGCSGSGKRNLVAEIRISLAGPAAQHNLHALKSRETCET